MNELIQSTKVFQKMETDVSEVFLSKKRIPEQVFLHNWKYYSFDHRLIFSIEFPYFLIDLSKIFTDITINYMSILPSAVDYYFNNFGFYGAASFETDRLINRYLRVMSRDGNVESFWARGGDVGVFWGSSKKWGIHCDRISWDLCLMGTSVDIKESVGFSTKFLTFESLKNYVKSQRKADVATSFMEKLSCNYPTL